MASPDNEGTPTLARSGGGDVLEAELKRYCSGEVRGRSFLVSGHRGAGKTTMVESALLKCQRLARNGTLALKPLPVYLLGPTLLSGDVKPAAPALSKPAPPLSSLVQVNVSAVAPSPATTRPAVEDDGTLDQEVLMQVVQGLHQAVAREFCAALDRHARREIKARPAAVGADMAELAARFRIELTEAPPPARLYEFWRHGGLLEEGALFEPGHQRGRQQGMRELVALVGVNHVHQRISGELTEKDAQQQSGSRNLETTVSTEARWAELARPLAAVAAGAAVTAAGAATTAWSAALGLLTALGALFVFRVASVTRRGTERKLDRTFVPDLSVKTLHRVLPELFDRLSGAGLAPVFIVDELDKVDDVDRRIYPLIQRLKKLFAERSFTCLLVDRGFYERLHVREMREERQA